MRSCGGKRMYIRSFTKIVDDATDIIRSKKGEMMLANFLLGIILIGILFGGIIILAITGTVMAVLMQSGNAASIVAIIILVFCALLAIVIAEGSIMVLANSYYHGQLSAGAPYAIGRTLKRIFPLMGYLCLEILGVIPIVVVGTICVSILGNTMKGVLTSAQGLSSLLMVANQMGYTFFIIVGIVIGIVVIILLLTIYSACFYFGVAALVLDELGPIAALKKNFILIKGEFKGIIKKLILIQLGLIGINLCFSMLVGLISSILVMISAFSGSFEIMGLQTIVTLIEWPIRIVFNLLFSAFNPAIIAIFYYNQKCKKEGIDIYNHIKGLRKKMENEGDYTRGLYKDTLLEQEKVKEQIFSTGE